MHGSQEGWEDDGLCAILCLVVYVFVVKLAWLAMVVLFYVWFCLCCSVFGCFVSCKGTRWDTTLPQLLFLVWLFHVIVIR